MGKGGANVVGAARLCKLRYEAQHDADDDSDEEPSGDRQASPAASRAVPAGLVDHLLSLGGLQALLVAGLANLAHDLRVVSSGAWKVHHVTSMATVRPGVKGRNPSLRAILLVAELAEEGDVGLTQRRIGGEALRLAHEGVEVAREGAVPEGVVNL